MESAFRVDVYNAAGARQNGTTIYVSSVEIVDRASRIGSLSFSLPAVAAYEQGFTFGARYRLYHEVYGYLGEFKHDSDEVDVAGQVTTVKANNELWKLNDILVGFNWAFSGVTTTGGGSVPAQIAALAGFTVTDFTSVFLMYAFSGTFQGQTAFAALDTVRKLNRGFFSLLSPGVIGFGRLHPSQFISYDALLTNAPLATGGPDDPNNGVANMPIAITSMRVTGEGANIVNRIVPRGGGQGETQIDLRYSNRTTPYTIQSRGNRDGGNTSGAVDAAAATRMYYIEDATSIATYGLVERVLAFNDLTPVSNSIADRRNAANALYDVATVYLGQFKDPVRNYEIECVNLPATIKPGSIVRVDYRGVVEASDGRHVYLRLDAQFFFVVEITRKYVGRSVICTLIVSTNGETVSDNVDVFTNILRDVDRLKLVPQPAMTYYSRNGGERPVKNLLNYDFVFNLGNEVLELNAMKCVFRTMPLRANAANNTGAGGATTATSSSGGGTTATSTSGGSSTPTSSSGGGSTPTSSSGGGSTPTSSNASTGHSHNVTIVKTATGATYDVFVDDALNLVAPTLPTASVNSATGAESTTHTHNVTVPAHTHTVTVPAHTHTVTVPAHTHDVTIPNHTHNVTVPDHTHPLTFGVIEDTALPTNLRIYLDGTEITSVVNQTSGAAATYPISTAGWWSVDLLAALQALADWHGNHTLSFQCASGQGSIFAEIQGRVTIQAIKVS